MTARRGRTGAVACLVVAVTATAGAAPALACTPHVNSQGPSVTIAPDYSDPANSNYSYDADGTYVQVVTCLG